ncbi:CPBP family intramembrane metalloprotease [Microbulbifer sp. CAU 1566]|uniref:CPBP family intramembrane glutamic endopeptidase n=1 Tax=Microbulbifer sp. CAU 1566 TaxID=2933269 RepID=UPI002005794A|nr:CPBP family intramembrane glutamic endopeptidase [Microbulbifer sp. CAU 1566]MCK7597419.1 CPBP family intramembrane metalloprotease [Microbulbifer sp. CAU 1566]
MMKQAGGEAAVAVQAEKDEKTVRAESVSTKRILVAALAVQLVALAIAGVGLYFSDVTVFWGINAGTLSSAFGAIALGIAGALVSYWVGRGITRSNTGVGATMRAHCEALHSVFRHLSWWHICVLALAAGVCEELLFRGFLQPWIGSFSTPLVGLVVASVIFGLLHYASFIYFLITAVMGLLLGAVYWFSGSLLAVIVWHAVYDLTALAVLVKFPRVLGLGESPAGSGHSKPNL